jgi:hypothetical protein
MSPQLRWAGCLGWLFAALLASGCGPSHLTVNIRSPAGTNQGRPLYMVVRAVDSKKYLSETYSDVAAKVVAPDDSVIETAVVYPGAERSLKVKIPDETSVAVSFLFTSPDGAWQALLDTPVPRSVDFDLLENRIRTNANTAAKPSGSGKVDAKNAKDVKVPDAKDAKVPDTKDLKLPEMKGKG